MQLRRTDNLHRFALVGSKFIHGLLHPFGWIIVIIVPTYYNLAFGQFIQPIPLGTDGQLRAFWKSHVPDIFEPRGLGIKQIRDFVRTIIKDNPFHPILWISLRLETGDCRRDEPAAIVRGRQDRYKRPCIRHSVSIIWPRRLASYLTGDRGGLNIGSS